MTVVRDPVDRIISLRNYMCAMTEHPDRNRALAIVPSTFILQEGLNFQSNFLMEYSSESINSIVQLIDFFL